MRRIAVLVLVSGLLATPLSAQSLSTDFGDLFTFGNCGQPMCLPVNEAVHGLHYIPSVTEGKHDMLGFLKSSITSSIASIPFAAAAGGVSFSFTGGTPVATAISPGPIFGERAQTLGKGRLFVGATLNGITYSKLRGVPLNALDFKFPHQNVGNAALGDPIWENDYIEVTTHLNLSLLVTSFVASYGLTDRLDVGLALPVVHASLSGSSHAVIVQAESNSPHFFGTDANPSTTADTSASGSIFGLGDLAARVKFRAYDRGSETVALVGELRLPTGNKADFLGAGATSFRALAIVSMRHGNFTPHLNAGVFLTGAADLNNRLLGTLGFDQLLSPKLTLAADLVTSFEMGTPKLTVPPPVVYTAPTVHTLIPTNIPDMKDNVIDASLGGKLTLPHDYHLVANVLVPLAKGGMEPTVMWTLGIERAF